STFLIVLSVVTSPSTIVDAMKLGADDYITKDDARLDLASQLRRALHHCVQKIDRAHLRDLRKSLSAKHHSVLVGKSAPIEEIRERIARAHGAGVRRFVVVGGSGTGKRAVADYIYATDPLQRKGSDLSWVVFNCGATTQELARAE